MIEIITMILSWVIVVLQFMINHSITKYRKQVSDLQRDNAQLYADVFALKLYVEDLYKKHGIDLEDKNEEKQ